MIDRPQTRKTAISVKTKRTLVLVIATVVGASAGAVAWARFFANSQAIAVVSIGRIDQGSGWIEEPQAVMERIQSREFAAAVAARAHDPEIESALPSPQYGGRGALTVRNLRDLNLLEIRISSPSPDVAKAAIAASVDELIDEHAAKVAPLIGGFQASLKSMETLVADTINSSEALTKRLSDATTQAANSQDVATLMAARASAETGIGALVKSVSELKLLNANIRTTRAVTSPSVSTPSLSSSYRIIVAGAIAGFLLGLLALQLLSGFFSDTRSTTRDLPPLA